MRLVELRVGFWCPVCRGVTTTESHDVVERYCPVCHAFTGSAPWVDPEAAVDLVAAGGRVGFEFRVREPVGYGEALDQVLVAVLSAEGVPPAQVDDEPRLLLVHPALWEDLVEWLAGRGLQVGKIPGDTRDGQPVWIHSPTDEALGLQPGGAGGCDVKG